MKLNLTTIFCAIIFMMAMSCSKEFDQEVLSDATEQYGIMSKSIEVCPLNDSIIPYPEKDRQTLKRENDVYGSSNSIHDDIYSLRDLPVNIIVKENIMGGGRFLTTQGTDQKIIFSNRKDNDKNQQFYIKVMPATTGIPYMIYSMQSNTPISIGHYTTDPDTPVLYLKGDDSSSWGASWDFYTGAEDGYLVIKNNDIMGGGPNYWDMYNLVIEASNGEVKLSKYIGLGTQEFEIAPLETFSIQSIEFINDASAVVTQKPSKVLKDSFSNFGPVEQNYTLQISETVTETSSFTDKTSISLNISTSFKTKVPFLVEGEISTSLTSGYDYTYGESSSSTRTISRTYPVNIPSMYSAELSVALFEDTIDMNYIAVCKGDNSGRIIELKGVWQGVSVSQGNATLKLTPLNENGKAASKTFIYNEDTASWDQIL